jgi:mRNA interferase YafQ
VLRFAPTKQFTRDVKRLAKRGLELEALGDVVDQLMREETLPARYKDHRLKGKHHASRECHVANDWLLIYRVSEGQLIGVRTGTHADLF